MCGGTDVGSYGVFFSLVGLGQLMVEEPSSESRALVMKNPV